MLFVFVAGWGRGSIIGKLSLSPLFLQFLLPTLILLQLRLYK